jgi:hypothetical protein
MVLKARIAAGLAKYRATANAAIPAPAFSNQRRLLLCLPLDRSGLFGAAVWAGPGAESAGTASGIEGNFSAALACASLLDLFSSRGINLFSFKMPQISFLSG